jgi:hypothetical protein
VLYEPQYYRVLLDALVALCHAGGGREVRRPAGGWLAGGGGSESASGGGSGGGGESASGDDGGAAGESSGAAGGAAAPRALPLCFICYRRRRYKEDGFEAMARARGFAAVSEVPPAQLHPDYREGYRLVELVHDGRLELER